MSIHKGGAVWAGRCMECTGSHLLHGSGNQANDEGTNINWGFYLSENITYHELINMMDKLQMEITTHPRIALLKAEGYDTV